MYALVRKLHMYAGLLNLSIVLVFGIVGLAFTFRPAPDRRERVEPKVEFRKFTVPAGVDDKAAAAKVWEFLQLPLTNPLPQYAIRRNASNDLTLDFYTPNGLRRAVVLEKENRIRLEVGDAGIAEYLNALHATTANTPQHDWRLHAWTYYTEFAIWSLIGMSLSGVYLWLATRPFYGPARYAFAWGCGVFIVLYALTR